MTGASAVAANGSRRLRWSLAGSAAAHAALAVLALRAGVPVEPARPAVILPVSLVSLPGGGGGGRGPEPPGPAAEAPPAPPAPAAAPAPPPRPAPARPRVARRPRTAPVKPAPAPEPAPPPGADAVASLGGSAGTTGGGAGPAGGGDGTGGDGSGGARAAYGTNPLPPYPLVARRLGHEGVVVLDVLVAADGRAAEVSVARSSGHPTLDESARQTVRERWRFLPARRDGQSVPSRVEVPIRFRLDDTRGG